MNILIVLLNLHFMELPQIIFWAQSVVYLMQPDAQSIYIYNTYLNRIEVLDILTRIITCLSAPTICGWQVPSWFFKEDKIEAKSESIFWILSIDFINQYTFNSYFYFVISFSLVICFCPFVFLINISVRRSTEGKEGDNIQMR